MNDPAQLSNRSSSRLVYLCGPSDSLKRDFCRFFRESIDDCDLRILNLEEGMRVSIHRSPVFLFIYIDTLEQLSSVSPDIAFLRREIPQVKRILICNRTLAEEKMLDEISLDGILMVDVRRSDLIACINSVSRGLRYVSPAFLRKYSNIPPLPDTITDKEEEILRYISAGMQNKQIAECVHSSRHTVKNHKSNMIEKLGLSGTAELFRFAIQHFEQSTLEVEPFDK